MEEIEKGKENKRFGAVRFHLSSLLAFFQPHNYGH